LFPTPSPITYSPLSFWNRQQDAQRGRQEGHDLDDWLQAEAEITGKKAKAASA
jgi:DUF2934 family protein